MVAQSLNLGQVLSLGKTYGSAQNPTLTSTLRLAPTRAGALKGG
jgi:hypothetical protein